MPTQITVSATTNYTGVALDDVGIIQFSNQNGTAEAIFSAAQFNGTAILDTVIMLRSSGGNIIRIKGSTVNASDWSMASWVGTPGADDKIIFEGAANAINTILGSDADDTITGGALADSLLGGLGNDWLDGGGGADYMHGGEGNDIFVVDNAGDLTDESPFGGSADQVRSSVSWTLAAYFERLTLTGSANLAGTGNALANRITGNSGNNLLDGKAGTDLMYGGDGNDTFYADVAGDIAFGGNGYDTVYSFTFAYTLSGGTDRLFLWTGAFEGTGNALANILQGNANSNTIHGLDGADTLKGMDGNDWLYGGGGADGLQGGAGADYLSGGAEADSLLGGDGADTLIGGGGADAMTGGAGNDLYGVDAAGDSVVEAAGQGVDVVQSTASHGLSANVENLTLMGLANVNGTGNSQNNTLTGNSAANTLDGKLEHDTLTGGAGGDSFAFSTALVDGNYDTITDFNVAVDTIVLDHAVFASLAMGNLTPAAFRNGFSAADSSDRIVYDAANGYVRYDPDGTGSAAQFTFATVTAGLALTALDVVVI